MSRPKNFLAHRFTQMFADDISISSYRLMSTTLKINTLFFYKCFAYSRFEIGYIRALFPLHENFQSRTIGKIL